MEIFENNIRTGYTSPCNIHIIVFSDKYDQFPTNE